MRAILPAALRLAGLALLVAFLLTPESFAPLFAPLTKNDAPPIYTQSSLLSLTVAHLQLVFGAAVASSLVAVGLGIFVTRPAGAEFLPLSRVLEDRQETIEKQRQQRRQDAEAHHRHREGQDRHRRKGLPDVHDCPRQG